MRGLPTRLFQFFPRFLLTRAAACATTTATPHATDPMSLRRHPCLQTIRRGLGDPARQIPLAGARRICLQVRPGGLLSVPLFLSKKKLEGQQPEATASWYLRRRRVTSTPSAKETGHARRICYQVTLDRRVCSLTSSCGPLQKKLGSWLERIFRTAACSCEQKKDAGNSGSGLERLGPRDPSIL